MSLPPELEAWEGFLRLSPEDSAALSDADLQAVLARALRLYAARAEERPELSPLPAETDVTATEVMVAVTAILKAVNLQLFELGMWQAWSGRH